MVRMCALGSTAISKIGCYHPLALSNAAGVTYFYVWRSCLRASHPTVTTPPSSNTHFNLKSSPHFNLNFNHERQS
jgi:hypothetical protein